MKKPITPRRYMTQLTDTDARRVEMLRLRLQWPYSLILRETVRRGLPALMRATQKIGRIRT